MRTATDGLNKGQDVRWHTAAALAAETRPSPRISPANEKTTGMAVRQNVGKARSTNGRGAGALARGSLDDSRPCATLTLV
jgi:hypothetical protein